MRKRTFLVSLHVALISAMLSSFAAAASESNIVGIVKDSKTGEVLPGTTVVLVGTSLGASTDVDGKYTIRNVPAGSYTVRATYIGYEPASASVQVAAGAELKQDFKLAGVGIQGEVVVVTAQAAGQNEAINTQLSSQQIVSVVSAARIQELPDANAAESVGRLPGVSILRNGGEGSEVVIRGLQPKYNVIEVDGVRMASSNSSDRSTDLSMISPNMLEGIEVSKTVTPDQDADVLGGTVNFKMREAKEEKEGLGVELLAQGGYNNLPDAYHKYDNYKYVGSIDGRFLDQLFGVFVQADLERRNLTSNELGASYDHNGEDFVNYVTTAVNLNYIDRDRQRANGVVNLDYRLPEGKITFSNFVSSGTTYSQGRAESFITNQGSTTNQHSYTLSGTASTVNMLTNTLNFEQQLPIFHVDARLSHTYSETKDPNDWSVNFIQQSAGINQFTNVANINPLAIVKAANDSLPATDLNSVSNTDSFAKERALTASLDLDVPVNLSDVVTSVVKFGGKYRYQTRSNESEQFSNEAGFGSSSSIYVNNMIASYFPATSGYVNRGIPITSFIDPNFSYGKFLDGNYTMVAPQNFSMLSQVANLLKNNAALIATVPGAQEGYARNNYLSTTNNYSGFEDQNAAYVMATINVGPELTFIPGVRYQGLQTSYTAPQGIEGVLFYTDYTHKDTTVALYHGYWLPDVNLRYKPFSWFDARLSYTNTVSYPDYDAIVPRVDVSTSNGSIVWNNANLVPTRSTNYDAYLSFYENTIGLFTVGGFIKQITNLIYPYTFSVTGAAATPYYPQLGAPTIPSGSFTVATYVNDPYTINNYGLELDWQTHFWYLPHPFNGLVLNVNFTHIYSRAQYPYQLGYRPSFRSPLQLIDTTYTDRLLDQPDNIVNLGVGYDYEGFSIRVSMLYQADVFAGMNFWPQLRTTTAAYRRWDVSVKQNLPWFGLQLYGDINNLNAAKDVNVLQMYNSIPEAAQYYDMTADIGLRWQL